MAITHQSLLPLSWPFFPRNHNRGSCLHLLIGTYTHNPSVVPHGAASPLESGKKHASERTERLCSAKSQTENVNSIHNSPKVEKKTTTQESIKQCLDKQNVLCPHNEESFSLTKKTLSYAVTRRNLKDSKLNEIGQTKGTSTV